MKSLPRWKLPTPPSNPPPPPPGPSISHACTSSEGGTKRKQRPLLRLCTLAISFVWAGWHPPKVAPVDDEGWHPPKVAPPDDERLVRCKITATGAPRSFEGQWCYAFGEWVKGTGANPFSLLCRACEPRGQGGDEEEVCGQGSQAEILAGNLLVAVLDRQE